MIIDSFADINMIPAKMSRYKAKLEVFELHKIHNTLSSLLTPPYPPSPTADELLTFFDEEINQSDNSSLLTPFLAVIHCYPEQPPIS